MSLPVQSPDQRDLEYEAYLRNWGIGNQVPIAKGNFSRVVRVPGGYVAKLESPRHRDTDENRSAYARTAEMGTRIHFELQRNKVPHIPHQMNAMRVPGKRYCTIMEDAGPNLHQIHLKQRPGLGELETIAKMTLEALKKMHALWIAHLDLKLENMFRRCIGDFGCSEKAEQPVHGICVSRFYRAPEVIFGNGHGVEVDLWSLGCNLFELFTGKPAFKCYDLKDDEVEADLIHIDAIRIRIGEIPMRAFSSPQDGLMLKKPKVPFNGVRTARQILEAENPENNPRKSALIDLILKMLVIDPKKRITAAGALKHPFFHSGFSTDLQFHLHLRGEDIKEFKTGCLQIEDEKIPLQFVEDHSCFHIPKQGDPYKLRYFDSNGVSEREIRRTIENGVLTLSRKDFPELS